jgi:phosphatidylglycerophosphatase A
MHAKLKAYFALVSKQPFWWQIATWFGAGTAKFASGTVGSLAALPFAFLIHITLGNFALFMAAIFMFVLGWWATKQFLANNPTQGLDPKQVVVDEVAGQWLVLAVLFPTWQSYLMGFVLFRIFDVIKPWPVCWADQKVKGAVGVMLDDFLAAMYPVVVLLILMLQAQFMNAYRLLHPLINFLGGSYVH